MVLCFNNLGFQASLGYIVNLKRERGRGEKARWKGRHGSTFRQAVCNKVNADLLQRELFWA